MREAPEIPTEPVRELPPRAGTPQNTVLIASSLFAAFIIILAAVVYQNSRYYSKVVSVATPLETVSPAAVAVEPTAKLNFRQQFDLAIGKRNEKNCVQAMPLFIGALAPGTTLSKADQARAWLWLGLCQYEARDMDAAIASFQEIKVLDPKSTSADSWIVAATNWKASAVVPLSAAAAQPLLPVPSGVMSAGGLLTFPAVASSQAIARTALPKDIGLLVGADAAGTTFQKESYQGGQEGYFVTFTVARPFIGAYDAYEKYLGDDGWKFRSSTKSQTANSLIAEDPAYNLKMDLTGFAQNSLAVTIQAIAKWSRKRGKYYLP